MVEGGEGHTRYHNSVIRGQALTLSDSQMYPSNWVPSQKKSLTREGGKRGGEEKEVTREEGTGEG